MLPFDAGLLAQAIAQEEAKKRGVLTNYLPPPAKPKGALQQALDEALSMEGRATFLPFQDTLPGSVMNERSWALPGMLAGAWNAFTAPGRAYSGRLDPTGPEGVMEALNVAGYAALADAPALLTKKATPGVLGANVYHGSPHKFDKFDSSKIGTGEGAQAYGHGLYLADSPGVARSYSNVGQPAWKGKTTYDLVQTEMQSAQARGLSGADAVKAAKNRLYERAQAAPEMVRQQFYDAMNNFDDLLKGGAGSLYKVDLPDEMIGKMLDWDKPLSQQPESVRKALASLGITNDIAPVPGAIHPPAEGGRLYRHVVKTLGGDKAASEKLMESGIFGIRYLDQVSRGSGKGTSNYVVFPGGESALKILERN